MLRSSSTSAAGSALRNGTSAIDMPDIWSMSNTATVSWASCNSLGVPWISTRWCLSSAAIGEPGGKIFSSTCCMSSAPTKRSGNTSECWPAACAPERDASGGAAFDLPSLRNGITRMMPSDCTIVAPRLLSTASRVDSTSSREIGRLTLKVTGPETSGSIT